MQSCRPGREARQKSQCSRRVKLKRTPIGKCTVYLSGDFEVNQMFVCQHFDKIDRNQWVMSFVFQVLPAAKPTPSASVFYYVHEANDQIAKWLRRVLYLKRRSRRSQMHLPILGASPLHPSSTRSRTMLQQGTKWKARSSAFRK